MLIPVATTEGMLRDTGGNPVSFGAQPSTWCHFERVTVERHARDGSGVLGKESSVLLAEGVWNPMPVVGSQLTIMLDNDNDGVFETPLVVTVRDRDSEELDGELSRFLLEVP